VIAMTTLEMIWRGLQARGFERVKERRKPGTPPTWRKIFDNAIYWDVCVADSLWNKGHFGCTIYIQYHPRARDSWGGEKGFLYVIRNHDFTPDGLEPIGTSGSERWPSHSSADFLPRFDATLTEHFSKYTTKANLLQEAIQQLEAFPKRYALRMVIAFLQQELGQLSAARQNFDLYLDKFPGDRKLLGPWIDQLFAQ